VLLATGPIVTKDAEVANPWGLDVTPRGLKVDACGRTSMARVFAAGAVTGVAGRLAVRAGADARAAVEAIDALLAGRDHAPSPKPWTCRLSSPRETELRELARVAAERQTVGCRPKAVGAAVSCGTSCGASVAPTAHSLKPTADLPASSLAAGRCLHCDCRKAGDGADPADWPCALRRWAAEYGATARHAAGPRREITVDDTHERVIYDSGKCISCGLCVQIAQQRGEEFGLTFIGRGFTVRVGVPLGRTLREGLTHCAAEVAAACPVGAICQRQPQATSHKPQGKERLGQKDNDSGNDVAGSKT